MNSFEILQSFAKGKASGTLKQISPEADLLRRLLQDRSLQDYKARTKAVGLQSSLITLMPAVRL